MHRLGRGIRANPVSLYGRGTTRPVWFTFNQSIFVFIITAKTHSWHSRNWSI